MAERFLDIEQVCVRVRRQNGLNRPAVILKWKELRVIRRWCRQ